MDDANDPGPSPASPLWRAWQGTSRANRLLAAGALAAVAVAGGLVLTGDDEDEPLRRTTTAAASAPPSPTPSPSATPSRSPSPSAAPSAGPTAAVPAAAPSSAAPFPTPAPPTPAASPAEPAALVLGGDDLGVTSVGAPYADAVRALSEVLGPPVADPAPTTACVGAGDREVEWEGFRLAVTDGRVSGWRSTDGRAGTPSGAAVGTTLTELQELYGDRLQLFDASPDSGPGFAVTGVQLGGELTGPGADDRVTSFFNRACSPP